MGAVIAPDLRNRLIVPNNIDMPLITNVGAARNGQVDWSRFDSESYCDHHYGSVRDDDHDIVVTIRDFFADNRPKRDRIPYRAIDVGPGANLYPTLAMLPFAHRIDLVEHATSNVNWLRRQRKTGFGTNWDSFWDIYQGNAAYRDGYSTMSDVRADFRRKTKVRSGSVFGLPANRWHLGAMFFVACSLSSDLNEFVQATRSFVRALKPGAPFAIAFMTNSKGYDVAGRWFPAVAVDKPDIEAALLPVAARRGLALRPIASLDPVRPEVGMFLATGFAA